MNTCKLPPVVTPVSRALAEAFLRDFPRRRPQVGGGGQEPRFVATGAPVTAATPIFSAPVERSAPAKDATLLFPATVATRSPRSMHFASTQAARCASGAAFYFISARFLFDLLRDPLSETPCLSLAKDPASTSLVSLPRRAYIRRHRTCPNAVRRDRHAEDRGRLSGLRSHRAHGRKRTQTFNIQNNNTLSISLCTN